MYRPMPPASVLELSDLSALGIRLFPAPEVWVWLTGERFLALYRGLESVLDICRRASMVYTSRLCLP